VDDVKEVALWDSLDAWYSQDATGAAKDASAPVPESAYFDAYVACKQLLEANDIDWQKRSEPMGGLHKVADKEGAVRWVCQCHAQRNFPGGFEAEPQRTHHTMAQQATTGAITGNASVPPSAVILTVAAAASSGAPSPLTARREPPSTSAQQIRTVRVTAAKTPEEGVSDHSAASSDHAAAARFPAMPDGVSDLQSALRLERSQRVAAESELAMLRAERDAVSEAQVAMTALQQQTQLHMAQMAEQLEASRARLALKRPGGTTAKITPMGALNNDKGAPPQLPIGAHAHSPAASSTAAYPAEKSSHDPPSSGGCIIV
jgi:hypothetical protein